jgi:hypothetical protein
VQDEPVVRVAPLLARDELRDVVLDVARRLAERESEPVRDAKYVRVDGERRLLERDRHHHVGRLSPDAR